MNAELPEGDANEFKNLKDVDRSLRAGRQQTANDYASNAIGDKHMYNIRIKQFAIGVILGLTLATAVFPQSPIKQQSLQTSEVASGHKQKVNGVIVDRDAESLVVRDGVGSNINVLLTDGTNV